LKNELSLLENGVSIMLTESHDLIGLLVSCLGLNSKIAKDGKRNKAAAAFSPHAPWV
jgi:hypothetical protein